MLSVDWQIWTAVPWRVLCRPESKSATLWRGQMMPFTQSAGLGTTLDCNTN